MKAHARADDSTDDEPAPVTTTAGRELADTAAAALAMILASTDTRRFR